VTTELLGLHPSGVGNEEGSVVSNELFLQLHSTEGIDIFGVVGDDSLGDSLADGVDLGDVSSTLDAHTDVEDAECLFTSNKDGLVNLESEDLGLDEVDRGAVNTNEATTLLSVGDSGRGLDDWCIPIRLKLELGFTKVTDLLFAESLNGLR